MAEHCAWIHQAVAPTALVSDRREPVRDRIEKLYGGRVTLYNSGRSALQHALRRIWQSRPLGRSARVAVPSFICACVPQKIVKCGFEPVYYDLLPDLTPSGEAAIEAARSGVAAILYPHLYGLVGDTAALQAFCQAEGIPFIEDCAAAFALTGSDGRLAGVGAAFAIFSFQEGKTIAAGSGGALLEDPAAVQYVPDTSIVPWSRREEWALAAGKFSYLVRKVWRDFGWRLQQIVGQFDDGLAEKAQDQVRPISAVDARLILAQWETWDFRRQRKLEIVARYQSRLMGTEVGMPQFKEGIYVHRLFVEVVPPSLSVAQAREAIERIRSFFRAQGIMVQKPYQPQHLDPRLAGLVPHDLAWTGRYAGSLVEVPTQTTLQDSQIDYVCDCLKRSQELI